MIKIKSLPKGQMSVDVEGTIEEITTQTGQAIYGIHNLIREQDPDMAELFKQTLLSMLNDPDSSVWKEE